MRRFALVLAVLLGPSDALAQACCLPDGSCVEMDLTACVRFGGAPRDEGDCASARCDVTGRCCNVVDWRDCDVATEDECLAAGSDWLGVGTSCLGPLANCEIRRPCCLADGTCFDALPYQCPGTFAEADSCAEAGCVPEEVQSCCRGDGSCTDERPSECRVLFGGTPAPGACSSAPCGTPGSCRLFASRDRDRVRLRWEPECGVANDFAVVEGIIGAWTGGDAVTCSTAGSREWSLVPGSAATFYLVQALTPGASGPWGADSDGVDRQEPTMRCRPLRLPGCD